MASSRDPGDNASFNELNRRLAKLEQELGGKLDKALSEGKRKPAGPKPEPRFHAPAAGPAEGPPPAPPTGGGPREPERSTALVRARRNLVDLGRQELGQQVRHLTQLRQEAALYQRLDTLRRLQGLDQLATLGRNQGAFSRLPPQGIVVPQRAGGAYEDLAGQRAQAEGRAQLQARREQVYRDLRSILQQDGFADPAAAGKQTQTAEQMSVAEQRRAQALAVAREQASKATGVNNALTTSLERSAIAADLASQRYRKHGALTTEFIEAAAKGQVTIRELGYQVGSTIGKFAGWTGAATAVYGVVTAMNKLRQGALDSASGVGLVSRVVTQDFDPSQLQREFRRLSQKFNVPIADVAQAVYGSGKVFNDQAGSIKGADAALFAMKVGELDAADATQNLTAIVNGFRLEADQLPAVFDAINQAQNKFGGNVGDLTRGVAKAGGQFKASGGDYRELIAILTTGARLTGASAVEVATAVGRSASVVRTPQGAARARRAGLDPTLDPLSLIRQAQDLARGQSPERVQEIARAIIPAGGQYARILVPIIQNAQLLNKALAETAPERAKGSAQRELAKALSQPNEEIKRLGTNLEQLGSTLAQSGLLAPLLLVVKTLNTGLDLATTLVDTFDRAIPDPFKPVLGTLLEAYGVMRLLRRFDVGGQVARGGSRGVNSLLDAVSASPDQRSRRQVTQGLDALDRFLKDERERTGIRRATLQSRSDSGSRALAGALAAGDEDEVLRRSARLKRINDQLSDTVQEEGDLRQAIAENDRRRVQYLRGIKSGTASEAAARNAGISYATVNADRPTTEGPRDVGASGPVIAGASGARRASIERLRQDYSRAGTALGEELRAVGVSAQAMGVTGRAVTTAGRGAVGAVKFGAAGVGAAARGIGALAGTLFAALGPLDIALLGIAGTFIAINQFKKAAAEQQARIDAARRQTGDPTEIGQRAEDLRKKANDTSFWEGAANLLGKSDYTRPFISAVNALGFGSGDNEDRRTAAELEARAARLRSAQAFGRLRTLPMIDAQLQEELRSAGRGSQIGSLDQAIQQVDQGFAMQRGNAQAKQKARDYRATLKAKLADLKAASGDIDGALRDVVDAKGFDDFTAANQARIGLRGRVTGRDTERALATVFRARQLLATGQLAPAEALKAITDAQQAPLEAAKEQLDRELAVARSAKQKHAAYARYGQTVGQVYDVGAVRNQIDTVGVAMAQRTQRLAQLRQQVGLAQLRAALPGATSPLGLPSGLGIPGGALSAAERRKQGEYRKLIQLNRDDRAMLRQLNQQLGLTRELRKQALQESRSARVDARLEQFDAYTNLQESQISDPNAKSKYAAGRLKQRAEIVRRAYHRGAKSLADLWNAIADANNAVATTADAAPDFSAFDTGQDLAAAQLAAGGATQGTLLRDAVQRARNKANERMRRLGSGSNDYRQALIEVYQAQKALNDYIRGEQTAIIEAEGELAKSRTENPIRQAEIQLRTDRRLLGQAQTRSERLQALARINNDRRGLVQTRQRESYDTIEFNSEVGRITRQVEIRELQSLLKRVKGNRDLRREIQRRLYALKHDQDDTNLGIDIGSLKIPTAYEVRRAVQGAARGVSVTNSYATTINVRRAADVPQVSDTMDRYHRGAGKSLARAAGER